MYCYCVTANIKGWVWWKGLISYMHGGEVWFKSLLIEVLHLVSQCVSNKIVSWILIPIGGKIVSFAKCFYEWHFHGSKLKTWQISVVSNTLDVTTHKSPLETIIWEKNNKLWYFNFKWILLNLIILYEILLSSFLMISYYIFF